MCDGERDCSDGSDELKCGKSLIKHPAVNICQQWWGGVYKHEVRVRFRCSGAALIILTMDSCVCVCMLLQEPLHPASPTSLSAGTAAVLSNCGAAMETTTAMTTLMSSIAVSCTALSSVTSQSTYFPGRDLLTRN